MATKGTTHGRAIHCQHATEIRLNEYTNGPAAQPSTEMPRARADSALPPKRTGASARAHTSLGDRAFFRRRQGRTHMNWSDRAAANRSIEPAIVGLGDKRIQ